MNKESTPQENIISASYYLIKKYSPNNAFDLFLTSFMKHFDKNEGNFNQIGFEDYENLFHDHVLVMLSNNNEDEIPLLIKFCIVIIIVGSKKFEFFTLAFRFMR